MPVYLRVLVPFMVLWVSLSVSAQSKTGSAQDKAQPDDDDLADDGGVHLSLSSRRRKGRRTMT